MESVLNRFKKAWNVFSDKDDLHANNYANDYATVTYSVRPDRPRMSTKNERSIVNAVYNRIALDVASVAINHVKLDKDGRFEETLSSTLNRCFNEEANLDQTGRAFVQDVALSLLDEGCVAMVPVDTTTSLQKPGVFNVLSMRTGKVVGWKPDRVKINVYNELTGKKEDVTLFKNTVGIVENPFYAVMNESNSTVQRLIRKLNLLDAIDEQSSSGKLDLIIQLPYTLKTQTQKDQADSRKKSIQEQLTDSRYGIAYTDATEKITQLNRPVENNLMKQIEFLTKMVYSQLGMTETILDGTANEATMLNYYARTVEPIVSAIVDEAKRKFISKTAATQGQSMMYFRDIFKLVPVDKLAELSDKFTRNEILSTNEFRQIIGRKPSKDPKADALNNKNIKQPDANLEMKGETQNEVQV